MTLEFKFNSVFTKLFPISIFQDQHKWEGFLKVQDKDFYISFDAPNFPSAKDIKFKTNLELVHKLQSLSNEDSKNLKIIEENGSVADYLRKIQEIHEPKLTPAAVPAHLESCNEEDFCHKLILDIEKLGWVKVASVALDFSSIQLSLRDPQMREHRMVVENLQNYPTDSPTVQVDLPIEIDLRWCPTDNLSTIYELWEHSIDSLQIFWNVLDALDETALVLDPEKPSRKHQTRRIILENQVSVHFTVEVECPLALPKYQLLGPSQVVSKMMEFIYNKETDFQSWNTSEDLVTNFERLFDLKIIRKSSVKIDVIDDWNLECAVCYSMHLDDLLPDHSCDHCRKKFHLFCLVEWLKILPTSRHQVQAIRGDCPICEKPILCKLTK